MRKNENKTKPTKLSASAYVNSLEDPEQKKDSKILLKIFKDVTKEKPVMWGGSIVGFGNYHYISKSGREGDWMITGFSPRKGNLSLYIMTGAQQYPDLLQKLGPYKSGVGCMYIKKLADIHLPTLKQLIKKSFAWAKKNGGMC